MLNLSVRHVKKDITSKKTIPTVVMHCKQKEVSRSYLIYQSLDYFPF